MQGDPMSKPDKSTQAKPKVRKIQLNKETLRDMKPSDAAKVKGGQGTAATSRRPC